MVEACDQKAWESSNALQYFLIVRRYKFHSLIDNVFDKTK